MNLIVSPTTKMSSEGAQDVDERIRQREEQDAAAAGEAGAVAGAAAAAQAGAALDVGAIQGLYLSIVVKFRLGVELT